MGRANRESYDYYYEDRDSRRARRREENRRKRLRAERNRRIALLAIPLILIFAIIVAIICVLISGISNKDKDDKATIIEPETEIVSEAGENLANEEASEKANYDGVKVACRLMYAANPGPVIEEILTPPVVEVATITEAHSAEFTDATRGFNGEMTSDYGILIDITTGEVVASRSGKDTMVPASMTKVLTVLTAARHIEESQLDEMITISQAAGNYAYSNDCSIVGFSTGEQVKVRDLFYGTILPSGGDAAYALAEYVAGDMDSFVEMMNETIDDLGLSSTSHFTNPVGIYDSNLYTTPYDMCMIMWAAEDNEFLKDVLGAHTYTTTATAEHPEGITISNWFLRRIEDHESGVHVAGGKTGFVNESGSCAVSYAEAEDGHKYVCCTGKATSSWRAIYDHVEAYKQR